MPAATVAAGASGDCDLLTSSVSVSYRDPIVVESALADSVCAVFRLDK